LNPALSTVLVMEKYGLRFYAGFFTLTKSFHFLLI